MTDIEQIEKVFKECGVKHERGTHWIFPKGFNCRVTFHFHKETGKFLRIVAHPHINW